MTNRCLLRMPLCLYTPLMSEQGVVQISTWETENKVPVYISQKEPPGILKQCRGLTRPGFLKGMCMCNLSFARHSLQIIRQLSVFICGRVPLCLLDKEGMHEECQRVVFATMYRSYSLHMTYLWSYRDLPGPLA